MRFLVDTTYRTEADEIMDDFSIEGPLLHDALDKLATINKWLGGNLITLNGLKVLLRNQSKTKPITIVDLGCGGGDILRTIADYGKTKGYNFELIGVDANKHTTDYARSLSVNYKNIRFEHVDVFSEKFGSIHYDIVITTLFLHHFEIEKIHLLLKQLLKNATLGIVINDLQRHKLAYYLFRLITIPVKNKMIIDDGLTSVLRGFKKKEIENLANRFEVPYRLKWKWAFRYQWILWCRK